MHSRSTPVTQRPSYPFTAIVGQERMKQALLLNAISSRIGGVLIRGECRSAARRRFRPPAGGIPKCNR